MHISLLLVILENWFLNLRIRIYLVQESVTWNSWKCDFWSEMMNTIKRVVDLCKEQVKNMILVLITRYIETANRLIQAPIYTPRCKFFFFQQSALYHRYISSFSSIGTCKEKNSLRNKKKGKNVAQIFLRD